MTAGHDINTLLFVNSSLVAYKIVFWFVVGPTEYKD